MNCADLGCDDYDVVARAEGIRDAMVMLLDEVKDRTDTMSVNDGHRVLGLIREIRGWLNGVENEILGTYR